ncbi:hypothetical protein AMAG_18209 [Allomyces macrogynus ATCC 38327]|uniref:Tyrosine specific protein phosphatases domain-containing protein n=1 Tax=Allomyces macrogynus (strain ATCC 38327) TaxID=578462 RepID=A0A0L0SAZ6_ALLM3|nr:hypothetical protein AMAG_18209 [Allomyces macrogynus ATCC 38327]|eukprot:KNE59574.1 hypothetical protein AMAG_18209 [Allomyces macrogynus ATCC 38327]
MDPAHSPRATPPPARWAAHSPTPIPTHMTAVASPRLGRTPGLDMGARAASHDQLLATVATRLSRADLSAVSAAATPSLPPHRAGAATSSSSSAISTKDMVAKTARSVVAARAGSVLGRQAILKSDHFPLGISEHLPGVHLQGAPNFRMLDLNVFGVAQPSATGLSTILTLLNMHPAALSHDASSSTLFISTREEPILYINGRPYVLRDADAPQQNLRSLTGIARARLEQLEARLKDEVIAEASRYHGLVLVHDELVSGQVVPCWLAADVVQTPLDLVHAFQDLGYRISYARIPVSPDQPPDDRFFDEYVQVLKLHPTSDPVLVSCGMGGGRTTLGTVVALLIRRAQLLREGSDEPFPSAVAAPAVCKLPGARRASFGTSALLGSPASHATAANTTKSGISPSPSSSSSPTQHHQQQQQQQQEPVLTARELWDLTDHEVQNKAMLRVMYILERGLATPMAPHSPVEWALARGSLIDHLKSAALGNYQVMLDLARVLDDGLALKRLVDDLIDRCDAMVNLREDILLQRVRHSVADSATTGGLGTRANQQGLVLDGIFFLLALAAYVADEGAHGFTKSFSAWLDARPEIGRMAESIRRGKRGHRMPLALFRPVDDLSVLGGAPGHLHHHPAGGTAPTIMTEVERYVLRNRNGTVLTPNTLLKSDLWVHAQAGMGDAGMAGADRFRAMPGDMRVYGVAQPTLQGMKNVYRAIMKPDVPLFEAVPAEGGSAAGADSPAHELVLINVYRGIPAERLELMESRLRDDVIAELSTYDGRVLVHVEQDAPATGKAVVAPLWEEASADHVQTLRAVVNVLDHERHPMTFYRVPITAEAPPDDADLDTLVDIVARHAPDAAIVVNDQVGIGRTTVAMVVVALIRNWLRGHTARTTPDPLLPPVSANSNSRNVLYRSIHSLLRVIRDGLAVKRVVDDAIDACAAYMHLRDAITAARLAADPSSGRGDRHALRHLVRYFKLLVFQAYLDDVPARTATLGARESFTSWLKRHPELGAMLRELEEAAVEGDARAVAAHVTPVDALQPGDGIALSSEVLQVVRARKGAVLGNLTILKHDAFPGCQKLGLPERVEGAPNFRHVPLASGVCGVAMPQADGVTAVLDRLRSTSGRRIAWTCLREEPVLYVRAKPYVLRTFQDPLKNLETTGIARERVERMEARMKADVLAEIEEYGGRLLLHDEVVPTPGRPEMIVPVWESVAPEDVMTPRELFAAVAGVDAGGDTAEVVGSGVDYLRVPITDEQAPIPEVFDVLVDRIVRAAEADAALHRQGTDAMDTAGTHLIFNCQMGRGRTTTGMVITAIVHAVFLQPASRAALVRAISGRSPSADDENDSSASASPAPARWSSASALLRGGVSAADLPALDDDHDDLLATERRYRRGEYRLIRQLVAVLAHGKLAKAIADQCIDTCAHMQNLREAIFDFKRRVEGMATGAGGANVAKLHETREVGLNYLVRYFFLVAFAGYLLEMAETCAVVDGVPACIRPVVTDDGGVELNAGEDAVGVREGDVGAAVPSVKTELRLPMTFRSWLADRREITGLVERGNQDFS